jgi:hypothetical protein
MNFQEFKNSLEDKLTVAFELLEYHYIPYAFGSGYAAYRINGYNYLITYDGRDNLITLKRSNHHEKYPDSNWIEIFEHQDLEIEGILKAIMS